MRRSISKPPRYSPRHSVRTACQVVRERDFRLVADRIVNVSNSGVLVMPADPVLTGERLLVSFQMPCTRIWIDAEATVARVIHGRRAGEHTRGLALEFEYIEEDTRRALRAALGSAPPSPPAARPGRRGLATLGALLWR